VIDTARPAQTSLPGYLEPRPVVFSSVYPISTDDYGELENALGKLSLNDPALTYERETSTALGFGFRCGFLGLLHLDVVQERLQREHGLSLLLSAPSVRYRVSTRDGELHEVENPAYYPDPAIIDGTEEPYIRASILIPERSVGPVMELLTERRLATSRMNFLSSRRVEIQAELPLAEVLFDFHDRLKTVTHGYGSYDYELLDYRSTRLVKVDILVNNAGTSSKHNPDNMSTEAWDNFMAINARGVFLGMKSVIPQMQAVGGGSIVNISSVSGIVGNVGNHMGYNASKGAVRIVTKSAAVQYAQDGIRVNSVHPGTMPPK